MMPFISWLVFAVWAIGMAVLAFLFWQLVRKLRRATPATARREGET